MRTEPTVQIHARLDREILTTIDGLASDHGVSRSEAFRALIAVGLKHVEDADLYGHKVARGLSLAYARMMAEQDA